MLFYTALWIKFSVDDKPKYFPGKQDLIFHANCLHQRQFAWNVMSYFLGKIRKISPICRLLNYPRQRGSLTMEPIYTKYQILFSGQNKNSNTNFLSVECARREKKFNTYPMPYEGRVWWLWSFFYVAQYLFELSGHISLECQTVFSRK